MQHRIKWWRMLGWLLLASCLILAGAISGGWYLVTHPAAQPVARIQGTPQEIQDIQTARIRQADFSHDVAAQGNAAYAQAQLVQTATMQQAAIGAVALPAVHTVLPIFAGTSDAALLNGVGTYSPQQRMGQGNYIMMSHNLVQGSALLNRLNQIAAGDRFYLTDFVHVYIYQTTFSQRIDERQTQWLAAPTTRRAAVATLFRCDGPEGTPWRWLVQGRLVAKTSAVRQHFTVQPVQSRTAAVNVHPARAYTRLDRFALRSYRAALTYPKQVTLIAVIALALYSSGVWYLTRHRVNQ